MNHHIKHSWVLPAVIAMALIIGFVDSLTALGVADYIFYFIPISLTVIHPNSKAPIYAAFMCSVFIIIGYYLSPEGVVQTLGFLNRTFAMITIWTIAFLVKLIIKSKNSVLDSNWVRNGMTEIGGKIRGELSMREISQNVLGFFSEYGELKAGSLYLKREGEKVLDFVHGHAFMPGPHRRSIAFGDGLLGQAALDKKFQSLKNLPQDYFKLSSSLGEKDAQSIFITPLMADNQLIGVMELVFNDSPSKKTETLVSETSEAIAITIKSAQNRFMLAELLRQSQQLSEELQAQQEELRVSNEELEQQSKALKESHVKLENQQAELEQSNQQLEEQAQTLEGQKLVLDEKNALLMSSQVALVEKAQEIAQSSQYKSEFLANMSHELRTPLNSSLILAKLLADNKAGNLNKDQIKYAEIIYSSGNDLLSLINDILDLSKVEAGKMTISPELIELQGVRKSLESAFTGQSLEKKLEFTVEMDQEVPLNIITDRIRLEQILKNFLSNAFKFTSQGFVKLQIYRGPQNTVSFAVTDSGIGIPLEQQGIIFEAFRQADGTTNRKFGGTGLGLSISKELTRLLGGSIQIKSTQGKGSTFILTIPTEYKEISPMTLGLMPTQSETQPVPKITDSKVPEKKPHEINQFSFQDDRESITQFSRKILIIEDEEAFAKILLDLAHEMKFGALVSPTAEEGIRLAQVYSPHAIVLDVRLPDHSGLLVLDQLKMNPKTRHIPVHIISSTDFSKSAMEMGAIGFLHKPVKRDDLQEVFKNLTSIMAKKEKHVLVVEDNEVQREHIVNLISDEYVQVEAVSLAQEALTKLSEKTYDCMIMDLSLPDLSGYELLGKLSNESSTYSYPPVIVYTARDLTREEEEKLRLYSGSIIIKGAKSPERLLNEVSLFLHRVETEMPPERQKMLKDLRSRERTLEERSILVVDDDIRNIFALTSALESFGAKIIVARNGIEALEKVKTSSGIDLVLMDIMMPEMDGHEAMRRIRLDKKNEKLPIIALTAKAMRDDQEKCLEAGANDYLAKPIDIDKLMSLIRVWLPGHRSFLN